MINKNLNITAKHSNKIQGRDLVSSSLLLPGAGAGAGTALPLQLPRRPVT